MTGPAELYRKKNGEVLVTEPKKKTDKSIQYKKNTDKKIDILIGKKN